MWRKNGFIISTDRERLDRNLIHTFVSQESYWGNGRSREAMDRAIEHSVYCFGVYQQHKASEKQVGFARVISDLTTFGYLADVFILQEYRGQGLGKWLVKTIVEHPELCSLKRLGLFTRTPKFYMPAEFKVYDPENQSKFMVRLQPMSSPK
nr:GNAT family N-acetyltransferase [uncultured Anaeromusa sp.]